LTSIAEGGGDSYTAITRLFGIDEQYLDGEMTVGELGDLAHFVKILEKASGRLQNRELLSLSDVWPDDCPSWSLRRQLRKHQNVALRVTGSDLIDAHLAVLSLYADAVQVDKRTADHIRKVRCRHDYAWLPNRAFRVSHYTTIPESVKVLVD
jgi:hypothetical protein